jgi:hypothetical protein
LARRVVAAAAVLCVALVFNMAESFPLGAENLVELEEASPVSEMVKAINAQVQQDDWKAHKVLKAKHMNSIKAGLNHEIALAEMKRNEASQKYSKEWNAELAKKDKASGKSAKKAPAAKAGKLSQADAKKQVMAMLSQSNADVKKAKKEEGDEEESEESDVRESQSTSTKVGLTQEVSDSITGRETAEERTADASVSEMEQLVKEKVNTAMQKAAGPSVVQDPLDQAIDQIAVVRHREHMKAVVAKQLKDSERDMDLAESNSDNFLELSASSMPPGSVQAGSPPKKQPPVVSTRKKLPKPEALARMTPVANTSNLDATLSAAKPPAVHGNGVKEPLPDPMSDVTYSKEELDKEMGKITGHPMTDEEATAEGNKKFKPWEARGSNSTKKVMAGAVPKANSTLTTPPEAVASSSGNSTNATDATLMVL